MSDMTDMTLALKIELGLIHENDLAGLRGVDRTALQNERSKGEGPPWTKIGKAVFYPIAGLRKYAESHTVFPGGSAPRARASTKRQDAAP